MGRKANIPSKETEQYILDNLRYDPETGHLWWTKKGGRTRRMNLPAGYKHRDGYIEVSFKYGGTVYRIMSHRIAWFLYYGYWPKHYIDHINHKKSDNRISNIREATMSQNMANRTKSITHSDSNSRHGYSHKTYVGVYRIPSGNWIAKHKKKHLGTFRTPEEAALCYNEAIKESHGEYAVLNDVDLPNESCHKDNTPTDLAN